MKHKPPAGQERGKKKEVEAMFDAIAPRYDLLNRLLSAGIDTRWRRAAVEVLKADRPRKILDVATGTGDLAIEALRLNPEKVVGVDISDRMLEIGRQKLRSKGLAGKIVLQKGDGERLPFSDRQFDAALVAFGVRNFEDLQKGLTEIKRVLRHGGQLVVLEFSRPTAFPIKQVFNFYFTRLLPRIGGAISRDRGAYTYLPESVQAFPDGDEFLEEMRKAGFTDVSQKRLTFGIASLYVGRAN